MHGEAVSVEQGGAWVPGTVLWEFQDNGRARALVRVVTAGGIVVRGLHWSDELRRPGRVLELPLVVVPGQTDVIRLPAPRRAEHPLNQPA